MPKATANNLPKNENTMSKPAVVWSVILVALENEGLFSSCLESFCLQDMAAGTYEVLVAGAAGGFAEAGVAEALKRHPETVLRFVPVASPGMMPAWHAGAEAAVGEVLTFTNEAVEVEKDYGQSIMAVFTLPEATLVTGPARPRFETEPPEWMQNYWTKQGNQWVSDWLGIFDLGDDAGEIPAGYAWESNYSIRRSAFFESGGIHPAKTPKEQAMFAGDGIKALNRDIDEKGLKTFYVPGAAVSLRFPSAGLTEEAFRERAFFRGAADAYSEIRQKKSTDGLGNLLAEYTAPDLPGDIHKRIQNAYVDGLYFFQHAAKYNHLLLKWMLRDSFLTGWEYDAVELAEKYTPILNASELLLKEPYDAIQDQEQCCRFAMSLGAAGRVEESLRCMRQLDRIFPSDPEITALTESLMNQEK